MLNGAKTYIGVALAFIGAVAAQLGVDPANLPEWAETFAMMIGLGLAAFGRWHRERRSPE